MRKLHGFTLIELLVLIAIAGILLTIGVPSLSGLIKDSKLVDTSNQINSLIMLARSEAIKRNHQTIICRSANNQTCVASGNKLIIISDANDSGSFENASDTMLKTISLTDVGTINIYFQRFTDSKIIYSAIGTPLQTGQIEVCDDRGSPHAKATIINIGGQMRRIPRQDTGGIACS